MLDSGAAAFAFPGMGIKLTGFEPALFKRNERVMRPFLDSASETAGVDLVDRLQSGEAGNLDDRTSQIFTLAFSAGISTALREEGIVPRFLAGYSFGLYAALFNAQTLTFSEILAIACRAFDIMERRCSGGDYGMAAIIGLTVVEIAEIARDGVAIVNVNSETCVICAGTVTALQACNAQARDRGAVTAELLPVRIPYHHPVLLAGSSDEMRTFLGKFEWRHPVMPIVSSIDGSLLATAETLVGYTVRHLCTPINWLGTAQSLHLLGVTRIFECGPGSSLSRHGMFMPFPISYLNVRNMRRALHL